MMTPRRESLARCMVCCLTIVLVAMVVVDIQVDAQFFTKSSKSIPRMGRRSVGSPGGEPGAAFGVSGQNRRSMMEALIDAYGPNLLEALEAKAAEQSRGLPVGEIAYANEQPLDFIRAAPQNAAGLNDSNGSGGGDGSGAAAAEWSSGPRNERSPARQPSSYRDSSLAMRALNTNRYIQHLASGQPLMSYDRLINGGQQQPQQQGKEKFMGES